MARNEHTSASSSTAILAQASAGRAPEIERMPRPTLRRQVAMRDGIRLATWVWLPFEGAGPFPAILFRTPYKEHALGWARLGALAYRDAGYAVVFQLIRGVGESEGHFAMMNPLDRSDGYDTIQWIAAQEWCSGAVGMDGSSYAAMTQLAAAVTSPPALRCIVPAVPSTHFFKDTPRFGGIFSRQHALGWTQFTAVDSLAELTPGLWGNAAFLGNPAIWQRLLSRPAIDAAGGVLSEDRLGYYRDAVSHDVLGDFYAARMLGPADYARITVPTMVVTGLFDGSMGSQHLWEMLERHAPADVERRLLIGPWDHGQAYVGGGAGYGAHHWGEAGAFDLAAARLAFFDRHLKGEGEGPRLPGRATTFVTGANRWLAAGTYPHPAAREEAWYLHSDGLANLRGHGTLDRTPPESDEPSDSFVSTPDLPFVPVGAFLDPDLVLDLRERERQEDVLVYTSAPLAEGLTLHGRFVAELHVAADAPDCDVFCWLAEVPPDGRTTQLSRGQLRLRYREGFDREVPLVPGEPVRVRIEMDHVGHRLAPGHRLRLLIGSSLFPLLDPNPNTGEPTATAIAVREARETVFHDAARPSRLLLPVLPEDLA
ncbi:CocE/NonD family hydrolase [Erythrobacter sp. NE805]|uniref:CocE/NonD family hydrolase n=1 Tax=Erythrobacter sp. NE805 TaxID=3389875 RepID=UPI00396B456E